MKVKPSELSNSDKFGKSHELHLDGAFSNLEPLHDKRCCVIPYVGNLKEEKSCLFKEISCINI
jgi:hypothetical protein